MVKNPTKRDANSKSCMDGKSGISSIILNLIADEWIKPPEGVPCEESRRWKQFGVLKKKNMLVYIKLHIIALRTDSMHQGIEIADQVQHLKKLIEASSRDSQVPSDWILSLCK